MRPFILAITGPAGSGKSTTASRLAKDINQCVNIDADVVKHMIVNGFIEPIAKELPLEYAVELNRLIQLEMEGSVG